MKTNPFFTLALLLKFAFVTTLVLAQSRADTLAIQGIIQQEITAWNQGDAVAYAQPFATNGTFTNVQGMFFTGQKTFLARHDQIFKGVFNKTTVKQKVVSFRFVGPGVAVVETLSTVSGFSSTPPPGTHLDAKGQLNTRLLQVLVREANNWKVTVYHNIDIKPGVPVPELE